MTETGISKAELVSRLGRLKAQEDDARAGRARVTYELDQLIAEQERIRRHLKSLEREETS